MEKIRTRDGMEKGRRKTNLVRRSNSLVTSLELNGEPDRISNSVSAPGRSNARLDGSKRLPVSVSRLESCGNEFSPNVGEVVALSSKEIHSLTTGDLGV